MKSKVLLLALLLMEVSVGAQTIVPVLNINQDKEAQQAIDLGLSVKWATCNVGAIVPEDYGNYYAWGETTTKNEYTSETYKYIDYYGSRHITKYVTDDRFHDIVDNKTTLELIDDAAYVNWGGNWRMPTDAEWTELRTQCSWIWTTQNGVNGYRVTADNGNSIFLPAAGAYKTQELKAVGSIGAYWLSSLSLENSMEAFFFSFNSSEIIIEGAHRDMYGFSVRPVCQ